MYESEITAALRFISSQQRADGSFVGLGSSSVSNFSSAQTIPTVFLTSLILRCLAGMAGASVICDKAARYLLKHRSSRWSWNYWPRDGIQAKNETYPDDLDDTACALIGLQNHDPRLLNGEALAALAANLVATEQKPGGPYKTWLLPKAASSRWKDVDIVVNANIGCLLRGQKVTAPGLEAYIYEVLRSGQLNSPYYVGPAPAVYFLSAWYKGPGRSQLRQNVERILKQTRLNALTLSLAITAACRSGSGNVVASAVQRLLSLRQDAHWPAEALYIHRKTAQGEVYVGGAALTTALAVEALRHYTGRQQLVETLHRRLGLVVMSEPTKAPESLSGRYDYWLRKITTRDKDDQIAKTAEHAARAFGCNVPPVTLKHLQMASLSGWVAYTIYDNFLDGEGDPLDLSVANLALRQSVTHFQQALPGNALFQSLIVEAFDMVDVANQWEVTHARGKELPDYGDLSQLANKSWGHILAACGAVLAGGVKPAKLQQLKRFFKHYLIARQLNDDAHDWLSDIQNGHLSAVGVMVLINAPNTSLSELRRHFWQHTILEVARTIKNHTSQARQALLGLGLKDASIYDHWLLRLESATDEALSKRQETLRFAEAYQQLSVAPLTIST